MKAILTSVLLGLVAGTAPAQELQYSRKTVLFHEAGYWCAEDYSTWSVGLFDTVSRTQNTPTFPAFYAEYDPFCTAVNPCSGLVYSPTGTLVSNTQQHWLNRPMANVNFQGVLMDPMGYNDPAKDWSAAANRWHYRRPYDTFAHYARQHTAAPNVTAVGFTTHLLPNDSLVIDTRVKFLSATAAQYNVAFYILEDSAVGNTNNGQMMAMQPHRYMVRHASNDYALGYNLNGSTAIPAGKEYLTTFSKKIPGSWNKNRLSYLMVTYRYDPVTAHYDIDNATKGVATTGIEGTSADKAMDMLVFPNPVRDVLQIQCNLLDRSSRILITLCDLTGRTVSTLNDGPVAAKGGPLSLPLPALNEGIYLLRIRNEHGTATKSVVVARP